jgi:UDP-GlcNAc:undecaprenyl-phosphate GlcNAc-1-phosphate transferase
VSAAVAFLTALVIALFGVPWARRVAHASDFVDRPADRKSHTAPVAYLGGIAIMGAVLVGLLVGGGISVRIGVAAMAAAGLGIVGLLDDDRDLPPRHRLLSQALAAGLALSVGVQAHVTGVRPVDALITIIWIVGITNAINLLDNMDGLAGGTSAIAGGAVAILALAGGQPSVARLAAALARAGVGFLVYNRPPATLFMGDAGRLVLGVVLAVVVLEVDPGLTPPATFLVPLLLLALPVLDTTTVVLARLRRKRPVDAGGKDHLSHRLLSRGLSPGWSVGVLVLAEVVLGVLAVAAGRAIIPLPVVAAGAVLVVGALSIATASADVYEEPVVGLPVRPAILVGLAGLAVVTFVVPTVVAMVAARSPAADGAERARDGLTALLAGDRPGAARAFADARRHLRRADDRLHRPLVGLGLAVPVLNTNLRSARTVVDVANDIVGTGDDVVEGVRLDRLRAAGGKIDLEEVRRAGSVLADAALALQTGNERVQEARQPYLVAPLFRAVDQLDRRLTTATNTTATAAEAARLAPAILGGTGTRRYLLAIENNAELRGGGGFIGNFGELTATEGQLRLDRFGRFAELRDASPPASRQFDVAEAFRHLGDPAAAGWAHVNQSPDFPTGARLMADLYHQSGGPRVDGVIAADPQGLAALLALTGPITVPDWPEPIASANVVEVTLRDQYTRFEGNGGAGGRARREDFLGDVGQATWTAFTSAELGQPDRIANLASAAARQRHLQLFMTRPSENALMEHLSASGRTPPLAGDSLLVVNHNGAANKTDYFLSRRIRYDVRLQPDGDQTRLRAGLDLTLKNDAPASGLPNGVIGPFDGRFAAGENVSRLSMYSPSIVRDARLGADPLELASAPVLGRFVHATELDMAPGSTTKLHVDLEGRAALRSGWFFLDLVRQPTVRPDQVDVRIEVPSGWRIADTLGIERVGVAEARLTLPLEHDLRVGVRLERSGVLGIWDKLVG